MQHVLLISKDEQRGHCRYSGGEYRHQLAIAPLSPPSIRRSMRKHYSMNGALIWYCSSLVIM